MGKNLIQQARGKGGPTYRAPSFRYKGKASHRKFAKDTIEGTIIDIVHCQGHSSPLVQVSYENGEKSYVLAPEGVKVGQKIQSGPEAPVKTGNTVTLASVPEGTLIYNIESVPGDGGKFVRASGTFAKVVTKMRSGIVVQLPSKKKKQFNPNCRVNVGVVAGGGRVDKPMLKAGTKYYKMKAKNKLWPIVSGSAMNAVDHPFGNARSSRKSKAIPVSRNAPRGSKVGAISPKRTGRTKR